MRVVHSLWGREEMAKIFSFCRRLDKDRDGHPLPVNLSRLIVNAQKRFNIDRNQVRCAVC